jgi:hypothetical protein
MKIAEELKKKHPSPSRELFFPDALKPGDFSLIVKTKSYQLFLSCRFFTRFRWHETTILERYYIFVSG